MKDFRKSLNSVLYERTVSPLFGTFVITWLIWNWKILYLTLFVSEENISENKIQFILDNYSNFNVLLTFPLLSTFVFLTLIPFLSNGAYWLNLKFEKWKYDKKHEIEKSKLLSIEESIELKRIIEDQAKEYDAIISRKETHISQLETELNSYKNVSEVSGDTKSQEQVNDFPKNVVELNKLVNKIKSNDHLRNQWNEIIALIRNGFDVPSSERIDTKILTYYESQNLIQSSSPQGTYQLTQDGKYIYKEINKDLV